MVEEEEVAVGAVTNYHVTLFLHRSREVSDKAIYVSDPVWWDQCKPSARASWLFFMSEAQRRNPEKAALARTKVPISASGHMLPLSLEWAGQRHLGHLLDARRHTSDDPQLHEEELPYCIAFKEEAVIYSGGNAQIEQGVTGGVLTAIKSYHRASETALKDCRREVKAYNKLDTLQGTRIPRLLLHGPVQDTLDPTLVLEHAGICLADLPAISNEHRSLALKALQDLHEKHALHVVLSLGHLVLHSVGKRIMLIDLSQVSFPKKMGAKARFEMKEAELKALLQ